MPPITVTKAPAVAAVELPVPRSIKAFGDAARPLLLALPRYKLLLPSSINREVPPVVNDVVLPKLTVVRPVAESVVSDESTVRTSLNELSVSVPAEFVMVAALPVSSSVSAPLLACRLI